MDVRRRGVELMAPKPVIPLKLPTGIEVHGNSIRISFSLNGKRYKETIGLAPTKQNILYAKGLRATVMHEIKMGVFKYAKHFPNSKHAFGKPHAQNIGELAKQFIDYKYHSVRRSTLKRYKWVLEDFCSIYGSNRSCETISPRSLVEYQQQLVIGRNGKTINRNLTTVKDFLTWLYNMEYVDKNFSNILKRVKENDPDIHPFSIEEISATLNSCLVPQHKNIVTLFVYTGIRTGELAALAWEDIDFENNTIHIRRSTYEDRGLKTTKTDRERYVDLLPPAIDALRSQISLTSSLPVKEYDVELPDKTMRKEKLHFVFNPKAVRAQKGSDYDYYGIRGLGRIWRTLCDKANIEYRNQYQLRHTYASWMITHANVNVSYLAQQMGHANITMVAKVYGKWLKEANKKESDRVWMELSKLLPTK